MEFTGERVVPGQVEEDLWAEHFSRYAFARRFASGKRVIDIGCGTGYGTAELAREAARAVGVDVNAEAVAYAAAHYGSGPNTNYLAASASALPFADASFDLATVFEVIEHLSDWRTLLAEARRVLRPDGVLLISTPNKRYYAQTRSEIGPNPFHVHEFEPSEFRAALAEFFPNVELLLQNRVHAFAFYAPGTSAVADAQIGATLGSAEDAHFLLAACSVAARPGARAFLYVPQASNVLQERERHIESLQRELGIARGERDITLRAHEILTSDLEEKIRWAGQLEQQLATARSERDTVMHSHDILTRDLAEKTQWALNLNAQMDQARRAMETAVLEGTQSAENLNAQLQMVRKRLHAVWERLNAVEGSRWLRLGRKLGLGPSAALFKAEGDD